MDIYLLVGKRIREERTRAGLTLEELAEASSISPSFLAYIELGRKKPSLATVQKLAGGLGVPVGRLFADVPPYRTAGDASQKLTALLRDKPAGDRDLMLDVLKRLSKGLARRKKK